jgi:hypothetical protein
MSGGASVVMFDDYRTPAQKWLSFFCTLTFWIVLDVAGILGVVWLYNRFSQ